MEEIFYVIILSFAIGFAINCWLFFLIAATSKKVKNKKVLKRWLRIHIALVTFCMFPVAGCSPGKMVGTGYLATVEQGIMMKWDRFESTTQIDSFVFAKTGITLQADSLIHPRYPFYKFGNGIFDIYVEKQGIYQRRKNGKKRWRMYDEKINRQP